MSEKQIQYQTADNWGFFVDIEKIKIQPLGIDNTNNNTPCVHGNVNVIDNVIDDNDDDNDNDDNIIPNIFVFAQIISIAITISIITYIILIAL